MDPPSKTRLFVTIWVLHGIALLVALSRIGFQLKFARIFWVEDGLSMLALLFLLGDGMLTTIMTIYASSLGEDVHLSPILPLMDSEALERSSAVTGNLMRLRFSEVLIFWTCLWLLKASFLALWYRAAKPDTRLKTILWGTVIVVTALAFVICTSTFSAACKSLNPIKCDNEGSRWLSYISLQFSTALDIATTLLFIWAAVALACKQRRTAVRSYLVIFCIIAVGCLIIVPAAMRSKAITHYRLHKTGYSWIHVWATIEASAALIACNAAEFVLLFAALGGSYKSPAPPSDLELRLVHRRGSRDSNPRPRTGHIFARYRAGPLQPPLYRKGGIRTLISVVPLDERDDSQLEANQSGILVTRDIDQRTADGDSIYSGVDASRSQILSFPGAFTPQSPSSFDGGSPSTPGPSPRGKSASTFLFRSHD